MMWSQSKWSRGRGMKQGGQNFQKIKMVELLSGGGGQHKSKGGAKKFSPAHLETC